MARQLLKAPPCPPSLEYLREWAIEIHGRSGQAEDGSMNRASWVTVDAWARRKRHSPSSHEIDALFAIDGVMCHPELK